MRLASGGGAMRRSGLGPKCCPLGAGVSDERRRKPPPPPEGNSRGTDVAARWSAAGAGVGCIDTSRAGECKGEAGGSVPIEASCVASRARRRAAGPGASAASTDIVRVMPPVAAAERNRDP
jgi:hypothetical protein